MPRVYWEKAENYHTVEIFLENEQVIIKDWWDPGKNPNITKIHFDDFNKGKYHQEIIMQFNDSVLKEIIESISILTKSNSGQGKNKKC